MGEIITVFLLKYDDIPYSKVSSYEEFISEERRKRISRFRFDQDKVASLLSGLMVRYVLSQHTGLSSSELDISTDDKGKPFLRNICGCHFSISHTKNMTAMAVDKSPIGIDTENSLNVFSNYVSLAEKCFAAGEIQSFRLRGQTIEDFYDIWTSKEAYVKMTGRGLICLNNTLDTTNLTEYQIITKRIGNFSVSVCCRREIDSAEMHEITLDFLLSAF